MHEYSIVQSLLERVQVEAHAHGAVAVHSLRVRIGESAGVEIDLLQSAYELFRQGSICERADLEIVPVPAQWTCPGCGRTLSRGEILRCIDCNVAAELTAGSEIVLERVELEVA